eukprot:993036-Ditylum_brightwellii.AAC.1
MSKATNMTGASEEASCMKGTQKYGSKMSPMPKLVLKPARNPTSAAQPRSTRIRGLNLSSNI